jgi:FAD/FMN-containing dehydrogenase
MSMRQKPAAPHPVIAPALIDRLRTIVGPAGLITDTADMAPYLDETRGLFHGVSPVVVRPASTAEVSAVVRACAESGTPIVPQGGNTGLCGGAVARGEVIISLGRMNKVRAIDPVNFTMTVDAGCVLADLQTAAAEQDRLFPLSLGAEGSCQIGGNLSTNAGGTAVIRYGNTRELTLGLEVVLPNGDIWDGLRGLRKNNTGYDLKHLFIGAEGTLGLITGAVLKLFPLPRSRQTAMVALAGLDEALELLGRARRGSADTISTFELLPRLALDISIRHIAGSIDPLDKPYDWYALIEFESGDDGDAETGLAATMERILGEAFEDGLVLDAAIAQSEAQRQQFWFLREAVVLAQSPDGASIKNDVSVPISSVPGFIRQATAAVEALCPGIRVLAFGHVGDGNVHFNMQQPLDADGPAFLARWDELNEPVMRIVKEMNGSFSAEHGIGLLKVDELAADKSPVELALMRDIKRTFDPAGIMNPGKVL